MILSGAGRYRDPWHPFPQTSHALAGIAEAQGYGVRICDDTDAALTRLAGIDLLIVNTGDPWQSHVDGATDEPTQQALAEASASLDEALARGLAVLAVHQAAASLRDYPGYRTALGASWEEGTSWHPPLGAAKVLVASGHRVTAGLSDFTLTDERYTDLVLTADLQPVAWHVEGGRAHPLVWARELGASRLVYDALGHDERSYASEDHRRLLARAISWLGAAGA